MAYLKSKRERIETGKIASRNGHRSIEEEHDCSFHIYFCCDGLITSLVSAGSKYLNGSARHHDLAIIFLTSSLWILLLLGQQITKRQ